jgi:hypothetical protein
VRRRLLPFCSFLSLLLAVAACALWVRSYRRYDFYQRTVPDGIVTHRWDVLSYNGLLWTRATTYRVKTPDEARLAWPQHWGRRNRWQTYEPTPAILEDDMLNAMASRFMYQSTYGRSLAARSGDPKDIYLRKDKDITVLFLATTLCFPLWLPAIAFSVSPALLMVLRFKRRRRQKRGACPECGYDLRATPDRCPECGFAAV